MGHLYGLNLNMIIQYTICTLPFHSPLVPCMPPPHFFSHFVSNAEEISRKMGEKIIIVR